jgi:hypothetical protein
MTVSYPALMKRGSGQLRAALDVAGRKVQQIPGCPILRAFCEGWDTTNLDTDGRVSHPLQGAQRMGHPPFRGASCRAKHQPRLNRELVSYQKAAHASMVGPRSRKSGVLRAFCEGWDTTNLDAHRLLHVPPRNIKLRSQCWTMILWDLKCASGSTWITLLTFTSSPLLSGGSKTPAME